MPASCQARPKLCVLSLGAGVQSSTLALMAAHGEFDLIPDAAIFADTGDEPSAVYKQLEWLTGVLPFPVYVVRAGDLGSDLLGGQDMARIPFHIKAGGLATRQCTRNYKIRPIRRKVRQLLDAPGGRIPAGTVEQWVGISLDEAIRMKPSGVAYVTNRWPLVEKGITRADCLTWLALHGYPTPPKSSCVFCPYRRDEQWRDLRDHDPAGWKRACDMDAAIRLPENQKRFRGELYAHRSMVPLVDAPLSAFERADQRGQPDLFLNECEGMCGV